MLFSGQHGIAAPLDFPAQESALGQLQLLMQGPRVPKIPIPTAGAAQESISWDGTVIWNGVKFQGIYDNTGTNCLLSRVNTQYGIFRSYIDGIVTRDNSVSGNVVVKYGHGLTEGYPYDYSVYRTHVIANKKYMRFWHGRRTLSASSCDSNAYCEEKFQISLPNSSIDASFLKGKQVAVILRGVDVEFGSSLNYIQKFQDAFARVWLDSTTPSESGKLNVNVATNYNGEKAGDYDATVYYTVLVFDPHVVSVTTVDVEDSNLECSSSHDCSGERDIRISGAVPSMSISEEDVTGGKALPIFVALKSGGFDESSDVKTEFRRMRFGARLKGYYEAQNGAAVKVFGEVFHDDCSISKDSSAHWKANKLSFRVISCKDTSICQAIYGIESGSEEAWVQRVWNAVEDRFETVVEWVGETFGNAVEWVGDAVEKLGDAIAEVISPDDAIYPKDEVLVVVKEGKSVDALKNSAVYRDYGEPGVKREFPFEDQDAVDSHVEIYVLQPLKIHTWLKKVGIDPNIKIPPLHRFYVLKFAGIQENERDKIIKALGSSAEIEKVSANYVAKLNAAPGNSLYSSSLSWFKPHLQSWWSVGDVAARIVLSFVRAENVYRGMALLYPTSSSTTAKKARYTRKSSLAKTHFQFPGRPAYSRNVCTSFVTPPVKRSFSKSAEIPKKFNSGFAAASPQNKLTPAMLTQAIQSQADRYFQTKRSKIKSSKPFMLGKWVKKRSMKCAAGRLIVKYEDGTTAKQRASLESKLGLAKAKHFRLSNSYLYTIATNRKVTDVLDKLQYYKEISYAEPDISYTPALNMNDPDFISGKTWHLDYDVAGSDSNLWEAGINAPAAWDYTIGNRAVTVAVFDTGNTTFHQDYYDNLGNSNVYINHNETYPIGSPEKDDCDPGCCYRTKTDTTCWDEDNNGYPADIFGWDFYNNSFYIEDDCFHGTAMAGLVGAMGNNGLMTTGVAPQVTVMPIKIGDCASGDWSGFFNSDLEDGIDYIAFNGGVSIANMSLNTPEYSKSLEDAMRNASSILFVASAGNDGDDIDAKPTYPASYNIDNLITVGGSDKKGKAVNRFNHGRYSVHIAAPAVGIWSLNNIGGSGLVGLFGDGTSQAAAIVSGSAALMYSRCNNMTPTRVKEIFIKTATQESSHINVAGGTLNLKEALEECLNLNDSNPDNDLEKEDCPNETECQAAIQSSPECQPVDMGNNTYVIPSSCKAVCESNGGEFGTGPLGGVGCYCCGIPDSSSYSISCSLNRR